MKPKILFVTTDYSYFTKPIIHALKGQFEVSVFDYYKPTFFSRLDGWLVNHHLLSKKPTQDVDSKINSALLSKVNNLRPEYLLVIKGTPISNKTIRSIRKLGTITINWFPDWLVVWPWIKQHAKSYDLFINSCFDTHKKMQGKKMQSYYLPFAVEPGFSPQDSCLYPITFIGQHSPRREKYFSAIADLGLCIWGYANWAQSSLKHVYKGHASVNETPKILRDSCLIVNVLTGTDQFQPASVNVRTFEALGAGRLLLVKYHPILKKHFSIHSELVTFTTPADLRRKTKFFLSHPTQREKIAKAGYNRILRDHTFVTRLAQLFDLVRKYESQKKS